MTKLKILFINPCLRRGAQNKFLPVGLASVITFIHQRGYEFDILDIDINEYDDKYVETYIRNHRYDVISYGSIVTHYKWIKWLTLTIKNYHPETKIIIGNSVAGSCIDVFMKHSPADVAVIGEGEFSYADVLDAFKNNGDLKKIPGIAFRDGKGNIIRNPHRKACRIDTLPMIQWNFFDIEKYLQKSEGCLCGETNSGPQAIAMPVTTARGCIGKCTFCHHVFWDDPYRFRKPDQVLAEIRRNISKYGANYINFWDDLSFSSLAQTEKMADAIIESGLEFNWSGAIRTDLLGNPQKSYRKRVEIAKKMKRSGCAALGFSLESGNKDILTMMNKHVKPEYFSEQVEILKAAGITSNVSVVFGYPIETLETIHETFDMCLQNRIYPSIGFLLPLPYTGMYRYAKKHGFIKDEDAYLTSITERQDICLNMTQLSDKDIMDEIQKCADRLNDRLHLGLDKSCYVRTEGYKRHTNVKEQLERHENDFSFNYSQAVFDVEHEN